MTDVHGIHDVTAMASAPQHNLDFCAGLPGLRVAKRTVNLDDPETCHAYFDEVGRWDCARCCDRLAFLTEEGA